MIKLKPYKGEWIVYNTDNFQLHTHVFHKRVAIKIRDCVNRRHIPDTDCRMVVESCMRLTTNKRYLRQLSTRLEEISNAD